MALLVSLRHSGPARALGIHPILLSQDGRCGLALPLWDFPFSHVLCSVLSDRGLGRAHFSTSSKCQMPFSSPTSPPLLSSVCCLKAQLLVSLIPWNRYHLEGLPWPLTLPASSPHSSAPSHLNCSNFPSLHSVHFSSVFCPCGKARRSAVSCLTRLHLRPPSVPLVDSGVELVETVSGSHSQAGGAFPDQVLVCSWATSVFLPWASFSLKGHGGWWAGGTGKGGQCREGRKQLF